MAIEGYKNTNSSVEETACGTRAHEAATADMLSQSFHRYYMELCVEGIKTLPEARDAIADYLRQVEEGLDMEGVKEVLDSLDLDEGMTIDYFITLASDAVSKYLNENGSLKDAEKIQRQEILRDGSNFEVNNLFYYQLNTEGSKLKLNLHNARSMGLQEKKMLFNEGLKTISKLLNSEPQLKNVKKVTMASWLVQKHKKFVKNKLGFKIDGDDSASLGREDFIRRYI